MPVQPLRPPPPKKRPPDPDLEPTTTKRCRRDVSLRIKAGKNLDLVARKLTLQSFCECVALSLHWDDTILTMNMITMEAWLLANYYVLRTIEESDESVELLVLDQTFFRRCMSSIANSARASKSCEDMYDVYKSAMKRKHKEGVPIDKWKWVDFERAVDSYLPLRGGTRSINAQYLCTGWFAEAATQMATNVNNSMWMNLGRRLRQFVKVKYGKNYSDVKTIVKCVLDTSYRRALYSNCLKRKRKKQTLSDTCTPCMSIEEITLDIRDSIPRKKNGKISWGSTRILQLFHTWLIAVEKFNKDNKDDRNVRLERVYSVVPTKQGFTSSYFTMTSTGLRDLLRRSRDDLTLGMTVTDSKGGVISLEDSLKDKNWSASVADLWWRRLFKVQSLESFDSRTGVKSLSFHHRISTDGKGVSVILHKTKAVPAAKLTQKVEDYDCIKGVDPGYTDIFVASSYDTQTQCFSDEFFSYPSKQFYSNSGYSSSNRRVRRKIDHSAEVKNIFSGMPSKKTASISDLQTYVEYAVPKMEMLFSFFMTKVFRNLRFRRRMLAERNLRFACRALAGPPGQRTLVAFGNMPMSNKNGVIKKTTPGPVIKLRRLLSEYCDITVVDEYLTSKIHHDCNSPERMENQQVHRRFLDCKMHSVGVHKVLHCLKRNGGCGSTVDRDVNASKNMVEIVLTELKVGSGTRPERLKRKQVRDDDAE